MIFLARRRGADSLSRVKVALVVANSNVEKRPLQGNEARDVAGVEARDLLRLLSLVGGAWRRRPTRKPRDRQGHCDQPSDCVPPRVHRCLPLSWPPGGWVRDNPSGLQPISKSSGIDRSTPPQLHSISETRRCPWHRLPPRGMRGYWGTAGLSTSVSWAIDTTPHISHPSCCGRGCTRRHAVSRCGAACDVPQARLGGTLVETLCRRAPPRPRDESL